MPDLHVAEITRPRQLGNVETKPVEQTIIVDCWSSRRNFPGDRTYRAKVVGHEECFILIVRAKKVWVCEMTICALEGKVRLRATRIFHARTPIRSCCCYHNLSWSEQSWCLNRSLCKMPLSYYVLLEDKCPIHHKSMTVIIHWFVSSWSELVLGYSCDISVVLMPLAFWIVAMPVTRHYANIEEGYQTQHLTLEPITKVLN